MPRSYQKGAAWVPWGGGTVGARGLKIATSLPRRRRSPGRGSPAKPPSGRESAPWIPTGDLPFIEQKNSTLVRAYIGYDRLDTVDQTNRLNLLYDKLWLYYNLFQPVMRLEDKVILALPDGRRRIRRRYDHAQTAFDRLCATDVLPAATRHQLEALRQATNPRQLRKDIYDLLGTLHRLPCAVEGQAQDVYLTLFDPPSPPEGEGPDSVTLSFGRTIPVR